MAGKLSRRTFIERSALLAGGVLYTAAAHRSALGKPFHAALLHPTADLPPVQRAFYTMGTIVSITAYGQNVRHVNHAINRVQEEFRRLDDLLSVFKPASALSRINRLAGKGPVRVEQELPGLLHSATYYHKLTNGVFDVTVEPLMMLWGFRSGDDTMQRLPTDVEIQRALDAVGMKNIVLEGSSVGLRHEDSRLDLGGIAVGYSVDRAVAILREEGIESAFVNHSGDAFALGTPPDSDGWEIAIPNPLQPEERLLNMKLRDRAISTSGAYEKYVRIEEKRYGHIIDPHSGIPGNSLLSTSIIAASAIEADALSTATFCMDWNRASSLARSLQNIDLVAVRKSGGGCELLSL